MTPTAHLREQNEELREINLRVNNDRDRVEAKVERLIDSCEADRILVRLLEAKIATALDGCFCDEKDGKRCVRCEGLRAVLPAPALKPVEAPRE